MTDDLVQRLRKRQEFEFIDGHKRVGWEDEDALAAADRIEELEIETRFKKLQAEEWACYRCEEKSKAAANRIEKLEAALRRLLLEFDFLIEGGHLPDIRNDIIFDDARTALGGK